MMTECSSQSINSQAPIFQDFDSKTTFLLINMTRHYWEMFNTNKGHFFQTLYKKFLGHGYNFPPERIRKKWNNLLVTYKRAKDRSRETGQGRLTWEYFEAPDSLLSKTVGAPPPTGSISCTALFPRAAHSSPTVTPHISPLPAPCTDSTPILSQTQTRDTPCLTSPPPSVTPSTSKSQAHAHKRRETQATDASHSFLQKYENHAERCTAVNHC